MEPVSADPECLLGREAGARKPQERRAKTQNAINRRRDQIAKIQQNLGNLRDQLSTTQSRAKLEGIRCWIDKAQEKTWCLEKEIYRMEQKLGRK